MQETHIASAFDRDLEMIQAQIMKMGGLVEEAIIDAATSLETRDADLAETVRRRDKVIDNLELQINEEAARVIALRAPTARDLRLILSVIKISANLERIGDYAKNMAKRTGVLAGLAPVDESTSALRRMAREVERMLKDALDSYIQHDVELAAEIILRDRDVDQMYNALFRELL
ncbi:MAG: phosphate signaling complex protein PhoU, partial [Roseovarius sp.]|nr:phosphate signaling complex protein PhoU [Roseovarius sp.]